MSSFKIEVQKYVMNSKVFGPLIVHERNMKWNQTNFKSIKALSKILEEGAKHMRFMSAFEGSSFAKKAHTLIYTS